MIRPRMTYVPLNMAKHVDDFIIVRGEEILGAVKARAKEYDTLSLLKLLYQLQACPKSFTVLYEESKIKMKRSFLKYLNLCVEYNFVKRDASGPGVTYELTEKGRTMLALFMEKDAESYK